MRFQHVYIPKTAFALNKDSLLVAFWDPHQSKKEESIVMPVRVIRSCAAAGVTVASQCHVHKFPCTQYQILISSLKAKKVPVLASVPLIII